MPSVSSTSDHKSKLFAVHGTESVEKFAELFLLLSRRPFADFSIKPADQKIPPNPAPLIVAEVRSRRNRICHIIRSLVLRFRKGRRGEVAGVGADGDHVHFHQGRAGVGDGFRHNGAEFRHIADLPIGHARGLGHDF